MKEIRLGIVGLGRMGLVHARNIVNNTPGAKLVAISGHGDLSKIQEELQVENVFEHYLDMLEGVQMDGVVIVSPTPYHPKHIKQALERGLHVFCEKPLGADDKSGLEIYKESLKYPKQVLQIGFMRRHDESFFETKKRLMELEKNQGRAFLVEALSEDNEADIKDIFAFGPTSGGQFVDVTGHDVDMMVWYLNSYPKRVMGLGGPYKYQEFASWHDSDVVSGLIEFNNGSMGFVVASRNGPQGYQSNMRVTTTAGKILINSIDYKNNVAEINKYGYNIQYNHNFIERFHKAYVSEMNFFVKSIRNLDLSHNNIKDALVNIIAIKALQESFETKKEILIKYPQEIQVK